MENETIEDVLKISPEAELLINNVFNRDSIVLPTIEEYKKYITTDDEETVEKDFAIWLKKHTETYNFRQKYVEKSFPILTDEFFKALNKVTTDLNIHLITELSCGPGWFTYWARRYGINIKDAIDDFSWSSHNFKDTMQDWVIKGDSIEYVKNNPNIQMFIGNWFYMDNTSLRVWNAMAKGQYLLSIGESKGGCTDSDEFFDVTENSKLEKESKILQSGFISFESIHDYPTLYKK